LAKLILSHLVAKGWYNDTRKGGHPKGLGFERIRGEGAPAKQKRGEFPAAACNQLLAEGWVLLGVYPLTTVGEMAEGKPGMDSSANGSRTPSGMCGG
jgi:hypothetical protein